MKGASERRARSSRPAVRDAQGGPLSRTLVHVRRVVDQSDEAFVFLGRGIGRFGSLATQGIEELTSLGSRRLGPGESESPSSRERVPTSTETASRDAGRAPASSPAPSGHSSLSTAPGDREKLRADIESALASLATEEPPIEARSGLEVLPFVPHVAGAAMETCASATAPSPLVAQGPSTAPLIRALATVVAEHDRDDPNSLHEDERLWLLVELLHSLTPDSHGDPSDHDDRESIEEDAPCTDCG